MFTKKTHSIAETYNGIYTLQGISTNPDHLTEGIISINNTTTQIPILEINNYKLKYNIAKKITFTEEFKLLEQIKHNNNNVNQNQLIELLKKQNHPTYDKKIDIRPYLNIEDLETNNETMSVNQDTKILLDQIEFEFYRTLLDNYQCCGQEYKTINFYVEQIPTSKNIEDIFSIPLQKKPFNRLSNKKTKNQIIHIKIPPSSILTTSITNIK